MLEDVINMLDRAINLNVDFAFQFAINTKVKNKIIELNTINQLFEEGIDSEGNSLGRYTDFTIEIKAFKQQRFDHVTLNDEGDFYNSFRVEVLNGDITIIADDSSKYDNPLTSTYGKDIIGLTDDSLSILIELITPNIIEYVENEILR